MRPRHADPQPRASSPALTAAIAAIVPEWAGPTKKSPTSPARETTGPTPMTVRLRWDMPLHATEPSVQPAARTAPR
ncbi:MULTISPECIES: hypothetical protein [Streptomyces]|uniref:Uncharacterized protein n=1 Tax=Streptomyces ramulosus TaxID=47762 RepID=A0ABW1FGQ8_9ACTN